MGTNFYYQDRYDSALWYFNNSIDYFKTKSFIDKKLRKSRLNLHTEKSNKTNYWNG